MSTYHLVSDPSVKRWTSWTSWTSWSHRKPFASPWTSISLAAVVGTLLLFIISQTSSHGKDGWTASKQIEEGLPGILHIVIPASRPEVNLCKNMVGATILGYPTPTLLNWGEIYMDPKLVDGGSHIAKITGMRNYLNSLNASRPDDLVLMVDGYDIWFQLRPQVLLTRYFEIKKEAEERIMTLYGGAAFDKGITQQTIVSVEKRCYGWKASEPPCSAVPTSTLPDDIYGPLTDKVVKHGKDRDDTHVRQRFLNSGVILGTLGSLKDIFARAEVFAKKNTNFGSDQKIFGHILGEQEVWRKAMNHALVLNTDKVERLRNNSHEYGLGLDYASKLGFATVAADNDTDWVIHSNLTSIASIKREHGLPEKNNRMANFSHDITSSMPPFHLLNDDKSLKAKPWTDVKLFTNVWTGIVPAIVHHNGAKSLREAWWDRIWYQKQARALLAAQEKQPLGPMGFAGGRQWWPFSKNTGGARIQKDGAWVEIPYGEVCDALHDAEVFREALDGTDVIDL